MARIQDLHAKVSWTECMNLPRQPPQSDPLHHAKGTLRDRGARMISGLALAGRVPYRRWEYVNVLSPMATNVTHPRSTTDGLACLKNVATPVIVPGTNQHSSVSFNVGKLGPTRCSHSSTNNIDCWQLLDDLRACPTKMGLPILEM